LSFNGITHPGYRWQVFDRKTGEAMGPPSTNSVRANRRVDQLDNKYGGYRYEKRQIKAEDITEKEIQQL
jgi:hypothetical protein